MNSKNRKKKQKSETKPFLSWLQDFYLLIWYKMNTNNPLAAQFSYYEVKMNELASTRAYKEKKEALNIKDRLDLWNTALYGEEVSSTLNATNSIALTARVAKAQAQRDLLDLLLKKPLDAEESYAQAA